MKRNILMTAMRKHQSRQLKPLATTAPAASDSSRGDPDIPPAHAVIQFNLSASELLKYLLELKTEAGILSWYVEH